MSSEHRGNKFRDEIELIQIHCLPGNGGIWLKARFLVFTIIVYRLIDLLEFATRGIVNYRWPGFISFTKSDGISVAWPAILPERLARNFSHVRSAHHNRYARSANSIRHAVSLRYHPGHRADTDKFDVLFANESYEVFLIHRARVSVN